MRIGSRALIAAAMLAMAVAVGAERKWETGTWISAGSKHDNGVAGGSAAAPAGFGSATQRPVVGTYVIETASLRLEIQDIVPIGSSSLESEINIGGPVTFAIEKNSVYVRGARGAEYRLRVMKKVVKAAN